VVPFFFRARVYTAYEYLERRFDAKTRGLATLLFLGGRSLSCGASSRRRRSSSLSCSGGT